jgi:membrane glycosyltransferase
MLMGPRLLSFSLLFRYKELAPRFGGYCRAFLGLLLETIFSALLAPTMMLFQSGFVISTFLDADIGWSSQQRDDKGIRVSEALEKLWPHCLIGVAFAVVAFRASTMLFLLFLPVVAGLVLSIPLSCVSSRNSIGAWMRKHKMFLIPEEIAPPALLVRLAALSWNWRRMLATVP